MHACGDELLPQIEIYFLLSPVGSTGYLQDDQLSFRPRKADGKLPFRPYICLKHLTRLLGEGSDPCLGFVFVCFRRGVLLSRTNTDTGTARHCLHFLLHK